MKQATIDGFRRITKSTAKKLYNAGETIRLCSCNISPVNQWGCYCDATPKAYTNIASDGFNAVVARNKDFETIVNAFIYYNCTSETGKYPSYYIKEGEQKDENV